MSNTHPSNILFNSLIEEMKAMAALKQADYGSDTDPFANVRGGAQDMGLAPWIGAAIRMGDKMRRIQKAARLGVDSLNFDSVEDDLIDMANYALIARTLLEEEK
jgi:hypothetical protein